mmetsp:Transcript_25235/g.83982  ORF Transcript_25235/g.83982 Transcript_25235/m.83982 type:complete len:169 (-) Transcript_25235:105-611(-)
MRGPAANAQVRAELQRLTGMAPLKAFLTQLEAKVEYVARGGDPRLLEGCLNIVLTGNPGAGKTTAARLLARWLRAHGLLQQDVFVERNALELKGTHVGNLPSTREAPAAALLALGRGGGSGGGGGVEADGGTREVCVTEVWIKVERSERCVSVSGACCRVYALSGGLC